jgi:predicted TIM-barrel fold metal-dependent hydrolase
VARAAGCRGQIRRVVVPATRRSTIRFGGRPAQGSYRMTEIIDAWGQHPTLRHLQDPIFEPLRRWTRSAMPSAELPLAATLAAMDAGGVAQTLISAWVGPRSVMISNDEVAGFVAQSGGRLVGVGSVDIGRPMAAMREVRRCVQELGFKAIRVLPWLWELPPNDRRFYPVYAACCEMGVPFCTQIGHTGPLMPSEVGRPIYLDTVALDFPELTIVGGHIGYPWTDEAVALATKHERLFIDTSAYTVRRYPAALVEFMRGPGRHKVLFGSNWPMIAPEKALEGLDSLALDEPVKALFLGGNARRVYALAGAGRPA